MDVAKAEAAVSSIINADEETRGQIRAEQLRAAQDMNRTLYGTVDEALLTPYGPPSQNVSNIAKIIRNYRLILFQFQMNVLV